MDHSRPVGESSLIPILANTLPSALTPQTLLDPTDIWRNPPCKKHSHKMVIIIQLIINMYALYDYVHIRKTRICMNSKIKSYSEHTIPGKITLLFVVQFSFPLI